MRLVSYCVQKPKNLELMNIKKKKLKEIGILHFSPNNILTILFKEFKKKMTINNI